jgi:hypothetical protein
VTVIYRTVKVDRTALSAKRVSIDAVLDTLAREISQVPGVARVDRFRDFLDADTLTQTNARRWSHQFPKADDVELVITLTPFSVFPGLPATHGSAYDYDTHVPLILYGPAFRPGRYPGLVRTVDLAPTLARIVGVTPSERLDGVVLIQAIR